MISFLILPMQRVTRLPLLMDVRAPTYCPLSLLLVLALLTSSHTRFWFSPVSSCLLPCTSPGLWVMDSCIYLLTGTGPC